MKETINELVSDELGILRRKVSGYKLSNENYRKQIVTLKKELEKQKLMDVEDDKMYESKVAECKKLTEDVKALTAQDIKNKKEICRLEKKIEDLVQDKNKLKDELEQQCRPWWKRIFG